jgi:hypothetical protein
MNYNHIMNTVDHNEAQGPVLVRNVRLSILALALIAIIILPSCSQAAEQEVVKHTRDPGASDVITMISSPAVVEILRTSTATSIGLDPVQAVSTVTPRSAAEMATTTPIPQICQYQYFFQPAPETCPGGDAQIGLAAEQQFEQGFMIWLESSDSIYTFNWDGSWRIFEDKYSEDQPENDPSIVPPEGFLQPVRGFGKVWREYPEIRDEFGWALGRELGFESALQTQEVDAPDLTVVFMRAFNGQVLALTSRALDGGDWVIAAS